MELIKSRVISSNAHTNMTAITLTRMASFFASVKKLPASQTCSNTVAWELLFALDTFKIIIIIIIIIIISDTLVTYFKITVYTS